MHFQTPTIKKKPNLIIKCFKTLDPREVKPPTTFTRFARKCNLSSALLPSDLEFFQHFTNRITIQIKGFFNKLFFFMKIRIIGGLEKAFLVPNILCN